MPLDDRVSGRRIYAIYTERFGQSYVYDANKNVTSASAPSGEKAKMQYDGFDNPISHVRPGDAEASKDLMTYGTDDATKKHRWC